MAERLTFTLEGRDDLSRVLGHAGESAERLRSTMEDAADGSGQAILTLTQDAEGRLRDMEGRFVSAGDAAALMGTRTEQGARRVTTWADAADEASRAGDALKKALLTLAPAALPAAASLAPIVPAILGASVAAGAFAIALGGQVSALGDASEAETKYNEAVEESGANSAEATKAQDAYAKAMAKLPEPTRQAAAALSVFKDEYADWSDSLAEFTMEPVIHGLATTQAILPELTPMVKGFAGELDRTVTIAAGGVASPGFDSFMDRMGAFSTGVMDRVNDSLVNFLRTLDTDEVGGGVSEFLDWARAQAPTVRDILADLGHTMLAVLDATADMGVTMLDVVAVLADLLAAVPPELIATLLQLAVAIKAVTLATAGTAAARAAIAALGTQLVAMRVAAAAAPGPLAAAGAAITTLSRTAKLAIAGTGIGILALIIGEIASAGEEAPIDIDKMTASLTKLGDTGQLTGAALAEFGEGFEGLDKTIGEVIDPSVMESFDNWLYDLPGGFFNAGEATEKFVDQADAIDKSLASLVSSGNSDIAASALQRMLDSMDPQRADKLRSSLDEYDQSLENAAFEQKLAADAMGIFGAQAQETQKKLDGQKRSADGLRQAIFALNETNRAGISSQIAFEQAIADTNEVAEKNTGLWKANGGTLDLSTEKGRKAAQQLNDLAAKTEAAAAAAIEQGRGQTYANTILDRGREQLIQNATQLGLNKTAVKNLSDQILRTPDKTARLRGNLEDLQGKLNTAKERLRNVPDSRKAAVRAEISQLERKVAEAKDALNGIPPRTVTVGVAMVYQSSPADRNANGTPDLIERRAAGGIVGFPGGGRVRGPGTSTSDSILTRLSNGEYVIQAAAVAQYGVSFLDAVNGGQLGVAAQLPAGAVTRSASPGRAAATPAGSVIQANITITDAMDPVRVGQEIQRVLLNLKRTQGVNVELGVG